MSIIVQSTSTTGVETGVTVQDIIDCASQEVQDRFANSGDGILINYVDRVQRDIIRRRPTGWDWLMSPTKQFVTRVGQNLYWVGPVGGQTTGQVDTGLDLSDLQVIRASSVLDRTGYTDLAQFGEPPLVPGEEQRDTTYLLDQPRWFRTDLLTPNVLEIYPSPMKAPDYQLLPLPPYVTTTSGGALAARTYYIKVTFVDSVGGESVGPVQATKFSVPANYLLVVHPPQPGVSESGTGVSYNKYNVYASTTEGSETKQTVTTVSTSDTWTEPTSGLIAGVAVPTNPTIAALNGFIIQFRYMKKIVRLTAATDVLLIPARYQDVVCAGVIALAAQFNAPRNSVQERKAATWTSVYENGLVQMLRDQNPFPGTELFIRPDEDTHLYRIR